MANRNGMGPNNDGAMTGKGLGTCGTNTSENNKTGNGFRMAAGLGRGLGKGMRQGGRGQRGFLGNMRGNNSSSND